MPNMVHSAFISHVHSLRALALCSAERMPRERDTNTEYLKRAKLAVRLREKRRIAARLTVISRIKFKLQF